MKSAATLNSAIDKFLYAHDRYLDLDRARLDCHRPSEREQMHIAILQACLEVQFRARASRSEDEAMIAEDEVIVHRRRAETPTRAASGSGPKRISDLE